MIGVFVCVCMLYFDVRFIEPPSLSHHHHLPFPHCLWHWQVSHVSREARRRNRCPGRLCGDGAEQVFPRGICGMAILPVLPPHESGALPSRLAPHPHTLHTRVVRSVSGPRRDVVAGVLHSRGHRASSWHESHSETVGPNRRRQSRLISLAVIRRVNQPATHILSVSPPIFKPMESGNGGTEEEMGHQQRNGGLYDAECMGW